MVDGEVQDISHPRRRWVINSPVLTAWGTWRFEGPLKPEDARRWLQAGFESAIGHASTAQWLSSLLGLEIAAQRLTITMEPGDEALVVRLLQRLPEGVVLGEHELQAIPYEFGLLRRLA